MNSITVIGNITEPEVRYTTSGTALATFGLATQRIIKDEKITTWHNVKCWGEMAEQVATFASKGSRMMVVGRIEVEKFTGKDGVEKTKVSLVADDCGISLRWAPKTQQYASASVASAEDDF